MGCGCTEPHVEQILDVLAPPKMMAEEPMPLCRLEELFVRDLHSSSIRKFVSLCAVLNGSESSSGAQAGHSTTTSVFPRVMQSASERDRATFSEPLCPLLSCHKPRGLLVWEPSKLTDTILCTMSVAMVLCGTDAM